MEPALLPPRTLTTSSTYPFEEAHIRILRILSRLTVGGPTYNVCQLTKHLNGGKYLTWLVTGRPEPYERDATELARRNGIEPIFLPTLRREIGWSDIPASVAIGRLLHEFRPHIVHTHTAKAGALGRLMTLKKFLNRNYRPALMHTFHGHVFDGYFHPALNRGFIAIERYLARHTDVIVTVSAGVRHELVNVFGIAPADKVRVIPLGFEFDWLQCLDQSRGLLRAQLGVGDQTQLIGIVGRLTKIKNHELALRAFRRVVQEFRVDAHLAIFGDGELKDELQSLASQLSIANRVSFMSWELDKARIYSDLDLTCLSSMNEGTPVALIESLAAGVPVVATRVGGVADVVVDAEDGAVVSPGDEIDLATALARLLQVRRRLSPGRRIEVCRRYSSTRLVSEMRELYTEILEGRNRTNKAN